MSFRASPFVPTQIAGCSLWLDAADTSTMNFSGTTVTQLRDKISSQVFSPGVSPTYITNDRNGRGAINFDGTQFLNNTTFVFPNTAYTVYSLYFDNSTTGFRRLINGKHNADTFLFIGSSNRNITAFTGSGSNWNDTNALTPVTDIFQRYTVLGLTVSGTTLSPFLNGTALNTKTGTTAAFTGLSLGGNFAVGATNNTTQLFSGKFCEFLVFNSALSASDRRRIELYLSLKWNLAENFTGLVSLTPGFSLVRFSINFSPTEIPDCALWLDGTDPNGTGIPPAGNTSITSWFDKSRNGRNGASNGTAPVFRTALISGLPALDFVGGGGYITPAFTNSPNCTLFAVVVVRSGISNNGNVFHHGHRDSDISLERNSPGSGLGLYFQTRDDTTNVLINFTIDAPAMYVGTLTNALIRVFSKVETTGTTNATPFTNPTASLTSGSKTAFIGRSDIGESWNGFIGEIVYYTAALSITDRQTVESYLSTKWNLENGLVTNHSNFTSPAGAPRGIGPIRRGFRPIPLVGPEILITFNFTGADQTFIVPATVSSLRVRMWGAGGASAQSGPSKGGAGAYIEGDLLVTPGETLILMVGQGGAVGVQSVAGSANYGGGGRASIQPNSPGGGGRSAICRTNTTSPANNIVVAGAGAGGYNLVANTRGGGKGTWTGNGEDGFFDGPNAVIAGKGGLANGQGGAAGAGNQGGSLSGGPLTGGNAAPACSGGGSGWGGGGGSGVNTTEAAGGGGGSSRTENLTNVIGFNSVLGPESANSISPFWSVGIGAGGINFTAGGNGRIVIAYGGSQQAPFSPLSITGCALWLDAMDRTSMLPTTGTAITTWNDKSGNGRNWTGRNNPQYNSQTGSIQLHAPSTQEFIGFVPVSGNFTAFFVATPNTGGTDGYFFGGNEGTSANPAIITHYNGDSRVEYFNANPSGLDRATFATPVSNPFVLSWVRTLNVRVNGFHNGGASFSIPQAVIPLTGNQGYNRIGSANGNVNFVSTNLREFIVYNSALSTSDRQQIEGYLASKWGLTQFLPIGHPHRPIPIPLSISGCQLWLDAADRSSMLPATGTAITTWNDKSGSGNHLTFFSGTRTLSESVLTLTAAQGDYTNSNIFNGHTNGSTFFIVFRENFGVKNIHPFNADLGPGLNSHMTWENNGLYENIGVAGRTAPIDGLMSSPSISMYGLVANTTQTIIRGNGTTLSSLTYNSAYQARTYRFATGITAGTVEPIGYNGQIFEILVFNRAINDADRERIEGYLALKWGFEQTLPLSHPHRPLSSFLSPLNVLGCQLWLDAADRTSMLPATGTAITTWNDKSGSGNHLTFFGGTRTLTDSFLTLTAAQGNYINSNIFNGHTNGSTFFIVFRENSGVRNLHPLNTNTNSTDNNHKTWDDNGLYENIGVVGRAGPIMGLLRSPSIAMYGLVANTVQTIFRGNGTTLSSLPYNNAYQARTYSFATRETAGIEQPVGYTGQIFEILVFNRAINDTDRHTIEGYLAHKWAFQQTLPQGHPHRTISP